MVRKIKVTNNDLLKSLIKKGQIWDKIKKLTLKGESISKEIQEESLKMQAMKDEILPFAKEESSKIKLKEFERVVKVDVDGKNVVIEITDAIEDLKSKIRAEKKRHDAELKNTEKSKTESE